MGVIFWPLRVRQSGNNIVVVDSANNTVATFNGRLQDTMAVASDWAVSYSREHGPKWSVHGTTVCFGPENGEEGVTLLCRTEDDAAALYDLMTQLGVVVEE